MDNENSEVIFCDDDGEYRTYFSVCDKLFIESCYKNNLITNK